MNKLFFKGLFIALILAASTSVYAQVLKFNPKVSTLTINGTSNLHDWKTETKQVNGEMVLINREQVKSLTFKTPVKSIKSGEKIMDSKTWETFRSNKHPEINFKMLNVANFTRNGDNISIILNGQLSMAGASKNLAIKATGKELKNGSLNFQGSVNLKMSDFKMTAPTAMMGMLKVGDGIKLDFNVQLDEQPQAANQ